MRVKVSPSVCLVALSLAASWTQHPQPARDLLAGAPSRHESYADLEVGAWTPIRIEVRGGLARLWVNGAAQPTLVVNDMKNAPAAGAVALWIDSGTEAHFSRLRVSP